MNHRTQVESPSMVPLPNAEVLEFKTGDVRHAPSTSVPHVGDSLSSASAASGPPGQGIPEATAPGERLLAAFDELTARPEISTVVEREPSPLDRLEGLAGQGMSPQMVVESPTPQWVLSMAFQSLPAAQETPLGEQIRAVLVEARAGRRTRDFKERLEKECPGFEFTALPSGAFAASGTMVNADVLAANKMHQPSVESAHDPLLAAG